MEKHINVIAILWIVSGALGFLIAVSVFGILYGISFIPDVDYEASIILRTVGLGVGIFVAILSLPELLAGIGLLKKKEWGRILTLVVAFLNLIWFPIWTALGIYSIVILLNEETVQLFKSQKT